MGDDLTDKQLVALGAMLEGKSQRQAAQVASVAPETITRWKASDAEFTAKLNQGRREVWDARINRIRAMADLALDAVESLLTDPDAADSVRAKLALAILDHVGMSELGRGDVGVTDPDRLRKSWVEAERSRQSGDALTEMLGYMDGVDSADEVLARLLDVEVEARAAD